jgi:hypothetical protein
MDSENMEFLKQLEQDFKDRYTEKDAEYMKCLNTPKPNPPIIKLSTFKTRSYYNERNWGRNTDENQRKSQISQHRFERRPSPYNKNQSRYNRDDRRDDRRDDGNGRSHYSDNRSHGNGHRNGNN